MSLGKDSRRTQRMATLLRAEMARLLIEEVSDPSLREIIITDVELSKDLKHARVFFAPQQGEITPKQEKEIDKGLHRAVPFFRRKIADNLDLRYVPELIFQRDQHGESVSRLLHIFEEVEGKE